MMNTVFKYVACVLTVLKIYGAEQQNLFEAVSVNGSTITCKINKEVSDAFLRQETFWITYEDEVQLDLLGYEIVTLPALCNLYTLVWFSGKTYYVDSMEMGVYNTLQAHKEMVRMMYPKASWNGEIIPRKIVDRAPDFAHIHASSRKGLLFSAGLDATASFFAHKDEDLHLMTAQGHPDMTFKRQKEFEDIQAYITSFAKRYDKRCSFFKSNYYNMLNRKVTKHLYPDIDDWRFFTMEGMSWMGLAMPLLVAKGCSQLYMGSAGDWNYNAVSMANPFADGCINCAGFRLVHDQFDKTRYEKVRLIVNTLRQDAHEKPFIKVCYHHSNDLCHSCRKCVTLMISLIALGEDIREYRFTCSDEEAVEKMLHRCKKYLIHWEVYNLLDIQQRAAKDVAHNPQLQNLLEPFLSFKKGRFKIDWSTVKKIDWHDVHSYAPWLSIPDLEEALIPWETAPQPKETE